MLKNNIFGLSFRSTLRSTRQPIFDHPVNPSMFCFGQSCVLSNSSKQLQMRLQALVPSTYNLCTSKTWTYNKKALGTEPHEQSSTSGKPHACGSRDGPRESKWLEPRLKLQLAQAAFGSNSSCFWLKLTHKHWLKLKLANGLKFHKNPFINKNSLCVLEEQQIHKNTVGVHVDIGLAIAKLAMGEQSTLGLHLVEEEDAAPISDMNNPTIFSGRRNPPSANPFSPI